MKTITSVTKKPIKFRFGEEILQAEFVRIAGWIDDCFIVKTKRPIKMIGLFRILRLKIRIRKRKKVLLSIE